MHLDVGMGCSREPCQAGAPLPRLSACVPHYPPVCLPAPGGEPAWVLEAQQALCLPIAPLRVWGTAGAAMTRVRAGRRPSRSAPAAVLSVPLSRLLQNPGVCPRGFQAWGDIGLEGKRAFSPKLLVLPGGVPLK